MNFKKGKCKPRTCSDLDPISRKTHKERMGRHRAMKESSLWVFRGNTFVAKTGDKERTPAYPASSASFLFRLHRSSWLVDTCDGRSGIMSPSARYGQARVDGD